MSKSKASSHGFTQMNTDKKQRTDSTINSFDPICVHPRSSVAKEPLLFLAMQS